MNLIDDENGVADYIISGIWSKKAASEAQKYCKVNEIQCVDEKFAKITPINEWISQLSPESSMT